MFDHEKKHQNFFKSSEMKPKTPKKKAYKYSLFCHILPPSQDVVSTENQGIRHQLSVFRKKKQYPPNMGWFQVLSSAISAMAQITKPIVGH